jgi:hypothetical protein
LCEDSSRPGRAGSGVSLGTAGTAAPQSFKPYHDRPESQRETPSPFR